VMDVVGRRVRSVRIVTTDKSVPPPPPSAAEVEGGTLPE